MKPHFISLMLVAFFWVVSWGGWTHSMEATPSLSHVSAEIQGDQAYHQGQWEAAIIQWQKALQSAETKRNLPEKSRIYSKIALAYGELGQWDLGEQAIVNSLSEIQSSSESQILAQVYNNWGNLEFMRGFDQQALTQWQKAEELYQNSQDSTGIILSQINQAKAFKRLGRFRRSCNKLLKALNFQQSTCENLTLDDLQWQLEQVNFPLEDALLSGWLTLADVTRHLGKFQESLSILAVIQTVIPADHLQGELWLRVGKALQLQRETDMALKAYQKVLNESPSPSAQIEAQLLLLDLYLSLKQPKIEEAIALLPALESQLKSLSPRYYQIKLSFNYINHLIRLKSLDSLEDTLPTWRELSESAQASLSQAQILGEQRLISYGMGLLGEIYLKKQDYSTAQQLTTQALLLGESLNTPEIVYLWQWQLGRILAQEGQREKAIQLYRDAIATHRRISGQIAANREAQFSLQETGENLYREAVNLLLQPTEQGQPSQSDLIEARQIMESLQITLLNNFFRDNCLETPESVDLTARKSDPTAAIIYPIILSDRLAIIVSLPQKPLYYYEVLVNKDVLDSVITQFRQSVVIRSRWDFLAPAAQLYNWLVRPYESILEETGIKTLIFVPDANLQNIPFSSLVSDPINRHYLVEKYQIAVTPSLELFPPTQQPLKPLSVLLGGITVEQGENVPLPYVTQEINNIKSLTAKKSLILKNEAFNLKNIEKAIRYTNFPIVHLATHGVFSSNFEDTYLMIWQDSLNIEQLSNLLNLSRLQRNQGIELLVLSACETATGDQRAALGLAGIAVRSGASSTLATLWSVNDEGTAYFMEKFYQVLTDSSLENSKAAALRSAQLELLENRWYNHPFYWSPFVLVGNWQ